MKFIIQKTNIKLLKMKLKYLSVPVLALIMAACGSAPNYRNSIPAKSAALVAIDVNSMAEKSGLSGDNIDKGLLARFKNMVNSGLAGSEALVDRIFDDADESGLGLKEKIYLFMGEQAKMGGLLVKVTDRDKLEELLEALKKQQICTQPKEADGCEWTVIGNWLLAYNDGAMVLVSDNKGSDPKSLVRQASMWLRQKDGEGFSASDDFKQMEQKEGDIVLWSSLEVLPHEAVYPLTMGVSAELRLKDVKAISTVDFMTGKTVMDVEMLVDDNVMKGILDKKQQVTADVKGNYLDVFPQNTPFWATANIKGGEFYDFICENPSVRRYFEKSMIPLDFRSVFNAINGDVALSMLGQDGKEFIAFADVTTDEFLKSFETLKSMAALSGGQVVLRNYGDNGYEFKTVDGSLVGLTPGYLALWIGVKDGRLYVTNKESLVDRRVLGLSLRNRNWGKRVEGQRFFMVSDLTSLDRLFELKKLKGTMASVLAFFGGLDYLTAESADGENVHIEIVMKDRGRNPLSALLDN